MSGSSSPSQSSPSQSSPSQSSPSCAASSSSSPDRPAGPALLCVSPTAHGSDLQTEKWRMADRPRHRCRVTDFIKQRPPTALRRQIVGAQASIIFIILG